MEVIIYLLINIFVVIFDQFSKYLITSNMKLHESIPIIEDVLHITYTQNTGAAFSSLEGEMTLFYVITPIALVLFFIYFIKNRRENIFQNILIACISGGAIGNFIDRIRFQYVIDFIDFRLINFAVFNIADSFLTVGVLLLVFYLIGSLIKESKSKNGK